MWLLENLKFHMWLTCISPIVFLLNSIHLDLSLTSQIPWSIKEEPEAHRVSSCKERVCVLLWILADTYLQNVSDL